MKRRILSVLLAICLLASMFPATAWADEAPDDGDGGVASTPSDEGAENEQKYSGGSGTRTDPYLISKRADLEAIADAVNGGNTLQGVHFLQTKDIDLKCGENDSWPVIGHVVGNTPHPFDGVYDGGDFNISGLFVGTMDEDGDPVGVENEDAGLFGHVGEDGIIRRVHVVDCKVYNKALYVGGIAGRNEGLVEYCSSVATSVSPSGVATGVIDGKWQYAGGIVGYNFGTISYCYSNCDVYGAQKVGGITGGQNGGTVVNCYFRGYVYASDITRGYAGGIAGENDGNSSIGNCYCDGLVEGYNENAYCGAIAGSNDTGSTVENCFWEDSEETGLPGIGSGMGDVDKVEQRTEDEFASGQVAWELAQGTDGSGWGQTLDRGEDGEPDHHPHFVGHLDTSVDTTEVYRVRFKYHADSDTYDDVQYVDPDVDLSPLPDLSGYSPNAKWYLADANGAYIIGANGLPMEFDGNVTDHDVDVVAGQRSYFRGASDPVTVTWIYCPDEQTVDADLEQFIEYDTETASGEDNFTYKITGENTLNATLAADHKSFTVPANTKAGEYTLTVTATEIQPQIVPLSEVKQGDFGTGDVTLTAKVLIDRVTPELTVTAAAIDYGKTLGDSKLTGTATRPGTTNTVTGKFQWRDPGVVPNVREAKSIGCPVIFTPDDEENYNTVTAMVKLDIITHEPTFTPPTPINSVYNGMAENLIVPGSAVGGTMKYWIEGDEADYSSTIPSRANAGTYTIWYKVFGDEGYSDTEPQSVTATISPVELIIPDQTFTYNGSDTFTVTLPGVAVDGEDGGRNVIATLTAASKNAGSYTYAATVGNGSYTVELSNSNYVVKTAGTLTIAPLPVVLQWEGPLTFVHDNQLHSVTAAVVNVLEGEQFNLTYTDNEKKEVGSYTAKVTGLGNDNYTLTGGQNVEQPWRIFEESEHITLTSNPKGTKEAPITYGSPLTLTVDIAPTSQENSIRPMADAQDRVEFFVNGYPIGIAPVSYKSGSNNKGTATLTVDATSAKYFSIGANAVRAEFSGSAGAEDGMDAITIFVSPKPITAKITGNTTKTYDGHDTATGLGIELDGVEDCDKGDVTVTADGYAYNSANVSEATTITAQNVTLSGAQSGNYVVTDPTTPSTIEPKAVKLEWRGSTGLVYTGDPVNVNATATELIPGDECAVIVENGDRTDAGSYTAVAVGLSNSNYKLPADDTVTQGYTIDPAPLYIPEQRVLRNGAAVFAVKVGGMTPTGKDTEQVRVVLTASSADVGSYDYAEAAGEGKYTARTYNTNYKIVGGALLIIEEPEPGTYPPVIGDPGHGDVEVTPAAPKPGDQVTFRPEPDPGYEVGDVVVKDQDGNEVPVTDNGDGSYSFTQPEGNVTILVSFVCKRGEHCPIWPYTDASTTAWYHDGVHYCIENGLMEGYGNCIFGPDKSLSRVMLAQILYNREGRPPVTGDSSFTDAAAGAWYADAVIWAEANGVVEGYGNGKFGPDDPITREQLAAMIYRYEQAKGGGFTGDWMFHMEFNDVADISGWAYEAICWCNMTGIVVGKVDGFLDPRGNATRAEAAVIIMRYLELDK